MIDRRIQETAAMLAIGDGVLNLFDPERHIGLWRSGPERWRRAMEFFEQRPALTRAVGAVQFALGVAWPARLWRER